MAEQSVHVSHFVTQQNQPLIGVILREKGREVVHYFAEESQADAIISSRSIQKALSLAGKWSDLNWEEMERSLDRIRHESQPTPPISL
jgi:hypothetical protein